ncbi:MAG: cation transporter [Deltaproteobacteria bacterium]|nr:cation transporter [Deltaproteobacteria bacterium]
MTNNHQHENECHADHSHSSHKEHDHHSHHHLSRVASRKALFGALVILGVFLVVETIGGILSGSLALLSDAAHLLTDVAAVGLAIFAQWFASRPPSPRRSFGYRRVEIVAALFNGLTLWIVAVFISIEALERIFDPPPVQAGLMLGVAAAGCVAQAFAALVLARASGESLNVRGAYVHALTDAIQSLGVIIAGLVIMFTGFVLIDPLISIIISVMIIWSGGKIVVEAVHILLEGTPTDVDLQKLADALQKTSGVEKVTDLHAWALTSGYNTLSAHIVTSASLDADGREALREHLTGLLLSDFEIHHSTLQVEVSCSMDNGDGCSEWIGKGNVG